MNSDFQQILKELYSLQRLGIKTGLNHTRQLLRACDNPQKKLKLIHVAGTNGKGSTCAMIYSILHEAGLKVGLYTSPHLIHFNERIRVNGIPISDTHIVEFMDLFSKDIKVIQSTFFETTTAMALWYFQKKKVDYAVIETGLGGRLDSTNVINPEISILTTVSMDHREILGGTIYDIAGEKAGIIKKEIPVISCVQANTVQTVFEKKARSVGANIQFLKKPDQCNISLTGTTFIWDGSTHTTSLIGNHQAINTSLAIAGVRALNIGITQNNINMGLKKVAWPGRFQILSSCPPIIYDVAHNADGINATLNTINALFSGKPIGLMALKEDKEFSLIASSIKDQFETIWTIGDENNLLMPAIDLSQCLKKYDIDAHPINHLKDFTSSINKEKPGLVFGSHYIAEHIFKHFHFSFDKEFI
ncbi:MAG: bifunctional folylpolyglutamate synthase/dihydrofolate synthase [Fidelibacterota bacterium]